MGKTKTHEVNLGEIIHKDKKANAIRQILACGTEVFIIEYIDSGTRIPVLHY